MCISVFIRLKKTHLSNLPAVMHFGLQLLNFDDVSYLYN